MLFVFKALCGQLFVLLRILFSAFLSLAFKSGELSVVFRVFVLLLCQFFAVDIQAFVVLFVFMALRGKLLILLRILISALLGLAFKLVELFVAFS